RAHRLSGARGRSAPLAGGGGELRSGGRSADALAASRLETAAAATCSTPIGWDGWRGAIYASFRDCPSLATARDGRRRGGPSEKSRGASPRAADSRARPDALNASTGGRGVWS